GFLRSWFGCCALATKPLRLRETVCGRNKARGTVAGPALPRGYEPAGHACQGIERQDPPPRGACARLSRRSATRQPIDRFRTASQDASASRPWCARDQRNMTVLRQAFLAAFAAGLTAVLAAQAADYPTRPVSFIVPYAAGGATDLMARLVGQRLEQRLGKPFV